MWRKVNTYGVAQVVVWDLVFAYVGGFVVYGGQKAASLNLTTTYSEASALSKLLLVLGVGLAAGATGATSRHLGRRFGRTEVEAKAEYQGLGKAQVLAYVNIPNAGFKAIGEHRDNWVNDLVETTARRITTLGTPTPGYTLVKECEMAALSWLASRYSSDVGPGVTGRTLGLEGYLNLPDVQDSLQIIAAGAGEDLLKIETCLLVMIENRGLDSVRRLEARLCGLEAPDKVPEKRSHDN